MRRTIFSLLLNLIFVSTAFAAPYYQTTILETTASYSTPLGEAHSCVTALARAKNSCNISLHKMCYAKENASRICFLRNTAYYSKTCKEGTASTKCWAACTCVDLTTALEAYGLEPYPHLSEDFGSSDW